jgi:hypothetical protein
MRLDELELRVARLEKWLDTLKEHAARKAFVGKPEERRAKRSRGARKVP